MSKPKMAEEIKIANSETNENIPIEWIKLVEEKFAFNTKIIQNSCNESENNSIEDEKSGSESEGEKYMNNLIESNVSEIHKWQFPNNLDYNCCYFTIRGEIINEEHVYCPNCMKGQIISIANYDDDVYIRCQCYNSYTPMHTPQDFDEITTKASADSINIEQISTLMTVPTNNFCFDIRNFTNENDQTQISYAGDDELTQQKLRNMAELQIDNGHLSSFSPNYRGCCKIYKLNDPDIPKHVYNAIMHDIQNDINDKNNNDQIDNSIYDDVFVYKMGIIQVEEFCYQYDIVKFINKNLKIRFGIKDVDVMCDNMGFLPIVMPVLREKVAQYYPKQLKSYDALTELIKHCWSFNYTQNRHGYTKFLFTVAKFFGFKPYTPDSGYSIDTNGCYILYNGICRCCDQRVYGMLCSD